VIQNPSAELHLGQLCTDLRKFSISSRLNSSPYVCRVQGFIYALCSFLLDAKEGNIVSYDILQFWNILFYASYPYDC